MKKIIISIFFIFFISKIYSYGPDLVYYNRSYIEFETKYPQTIHYTLCEDRDCKIIKEIYPVICSIEKCVMELNETQIKNFYGNNMLRLVNHYYYREEYNFIASSSFMYAINYALSELPSTEGGKAQLTGNYLRHYVNDYYTVEGFQRGKSFNLDVDRENFDPENLTLNFPPGYGSFILHLDKTYRISMLLNYAPPCISQCIYKDSKITLNGFNFYNNQSLAQVYINGEKVSIISIDHRLLKLDYYFIDYSQRLNIKIIIGDISSKNNYTCDIKPQPVSITTTVSTSKYNSGIITISGNYMSSSQTSSTNVSLISSENKSYNCEYISSTKSHIVCLLEPGEGLINKVKIKIGDVESLTEMNFKFGVPQFTSTNAIQIDRTNEFSLTGINFGNINDKNGTVKLLIDGNENKEIITTSISNDETKLSFKLPNICETSVKLSIEVNGAISNNSIIIKPQPTFISVPSRPLTNGSSLHIDKYFSCKDKIVKPSITVDSSNNHIDCTIISNLASCNVGVGTGKHSFKFYEDGIEKIDSLFQYAPPTIVSHNVNGLKTITLTGYNFGIDSSKCNLIFANKNVTCKVISDTTITFNTSSQYDYGNVSLIIDSIPMSNENYKIMLNFENKEPDNKSSPLKKILIPTLVGGFALCTAAFIGYKYRENIFKKINKLKNGKSNV
ncbi:hypothetical protein DICPUDRAFT_77367 [Dictyostelium purpureum]|uniref:Uncharacterized protein n=1 Tax=Dictyostelium purpureum TaxID=5786 RepID=F0ZGE5_DICPU|nr:uncharacterized protein DICPUDRAFT_77367 [Dictyostelium purpureum]EGC36996.1 hypothetical protein DICPUDRAFT_77367 [Dictyostelium purpureum]|eukprot:XP_003286493.1 hypothetical protein DICPUDRAFT_77367 [Dictyostelium purpureum]